MSSIETMTIQGIRSYGPRDKDTQVIQFFFPVTLIVGQNGCGKTTIIECLKYATTGDLPPNSRGGAFVFDPKLLDEIETKGRIKLKIRDTTSNYVEIQKNLSVTQKAKKIEFKTLETIITRFDANLKVKGTITSKCINCDYEIVQALGVSKAVLDNVIFCHQEESSWPLSDGKTLKTKFDEIFAATKYIKALDALKKIRLEKQQLIKQHEIEKKHLVAYKEKSDDLSRKIDDSTAKYETNKQLLQELDTKLKPIEENLEKIDKQSQKIYELQSKYDRVNNEKLLLEKSIKEILQVLQEPLEGSDQELLVYITEFKTKISTIQNDIKENERRIYGLQCENRRILSDKSKLVSEIGALENEQKNYLANIDKLNIKFAYLAGEIDFYFDRNVCVDENLLKSFQLHFNNAKKELENSVYCLINEAKSKESQYDMEINKNRDCKIRFEQQISTKRDQIDTNLREINSIMLQLKNVQSSHEKLTKIDEQIEDYEMALSEKQSKFNMDSTRKELKQLENERKILTNELNLVSKKLDIIHENTAVNTEIELLKRDKTLKEENIKKIRLRHKDEFYEFFGDEFNVFKNAEIKSQFDSNYLMLLSNIESFELKNKNTNKTLISLESNRKTLNEQLRKCEQEYRLCEDKLQLIDSIDDFDINLSMKKEESRTLMDEKGFYNGVDKTYDRFLKQLNSNHNSDHQNCPLCLRVFKDDNELEETINEIKRMSLKIPTKRKEIDEKLAKINKECEKMFELKPVKDKYEKLKTEDIPNLRKQIEKLDENDLKQARLAVKLNENELNQLIERKKLADSLKNEIIFIDKYLSEINDLERKIDNKVNTFNRTFSNENSLLNEADTLENVKSEKDHLNEQLNRIIQDYDLKRNEFEKNKETIQSYQDKLNHLKSEKFTLTANLQKVDQLSQKLNELKRTNQVEKDKIQELEEQIEPLNVKIQELISERKIQISKYEANIEKSKERLTKLEKSKNEFDGYLKISKNFEENHKKRLLEAKYELEELERNEKLNINEEEKLKYELETQKSDFSRQEIKNRELEDNRKLREKRVEYNAKLKQLEELEAKMDGINYKNIKIEKEKYEKKREELMKEKSTLKINLFNFEGILNTLKNEMDTDQYKNAYDNYRVCTSDLKVLEMTVHDIDKYAKALDKAIMNYHNMKMDEINKTIKHLWKQVYRGTDIDWIEIRSDDADGKTEEIDLSKRKTYNYRVVIIKGDTVLDMRGRCSMGQKVLASIIIRLALAETFCLNCGILALDEPTTNLDRENIESLATALVEIIKSRSNQKNFQLVIITHDEDFVELLGRSEYMDEFFRVSKDERGFSRITRQNAMNF